MSSNVEVQGNHNTLTNIFLHFTGLVLLVVGYVGAVHWSDDQVSDVLGGATFEPKYESVEGNLTEVPTDIDAAATLIDLHGK